MNTPKYLNDIDDLIRGTSFGEFDVRITRHRSKTTKVTFNKKSTLHPKSNPEAFSDLEKLINTLITATFEGKLDFAIEFKRGTINLITIKNKEIKNYG